MRKAMPTTVENWLGSFMESAEDNITLLESTITLLDKCPLGSAAGFGVSSIKTDNNMTAKELGFKEPILHPLYAQLSRGKHEGTILSALSAVIYDLNKLATDIILFSMQEFGYVTLSKSICTGSSIMPNKNNPDVLEIIRANYHIVLAEEFKIKGISSNLMSGYNRDLQLTKEPLMKAFKIVNDSCKAMIEVLLNLKIDSESCKLGITKDMEAADQVHEMVKTGISFREAYNKVKFINKY